MFMVLSSWLSHFESSLGSYDEYGAKDRDVNEASKVRGRGRGQGQKKFARPRPNNVRLRPYSASARDAILTMNY